MPPYNRLQGVRKISNEELVKIIKNCPAENRKQFIEELYFKNWGLMKKMIKPYLCFAEEDELLDECFIGLHEAVEHYEPDKGAFSSYACYWYRQSVFRFLEESGFIIRIPVHFRQKIRRYKKSVEELSNILGHFPTDGEVADYMGLELSEVLDIKLHQCNMASLDASAETGEDNEICLSDTIADDYSLENDVIEEVYAEQEKTALWGICERYMSGSEYEIIEDYYRNGKNAAEIAREKEMGYQKVRNLKENGLRKMRKGNARKELLERLEIVEASEYRTGLSNFKEHQESKVEYLVRKRMEIEEMRKKLYA